MHHALGDGRFALFLEMHATIIGARSARCGTSTYPAIVTCQLSAAQRLLAAAGPDDVAVLAGLVTLTNAATAEPDPSFSVVPKPGRCRRHPDSRLSRMPLLRGIEGLLTYRSRETPGSAR